LLQAEHVRLEVDEDVGGLVEECLTQQIRAHAASVSRPSARSGEVPGRVGAG
jgi:hypothetical protein